MTRRPVFHVEHPTTPTPPATVRVPYGPTVARRPVTNPSLALALAGAMSLRDGDPLLDAIARTKAQEAAVVAATTAADGSTAQPVGNGDGTLTPMGPSPANVSSPGGWGWHRAWAKHSHGTWEGKLRGNRKAGRRDKSRSLRRASDVDAVGWTKILHYTSVGQRGDTGLAVVQAALDGVTGGESSARWSIMERCRRWCVRHGLPPWTAAQLARAAKKFGALKTVTA